MPSNLDLITKAYRMVNVIPMTAAPSAELGSEALGHMNDMMATWVSDTIDLGYFAQDDISASIPVPDEAVEAVKSNLAVMLAGIAGLEVPAWVDRLATRTYNTLLRIAVVDAMEPADMSDMPQGQGSLRSNSILTGD